MTVRASAWFLYAAEQPEVKEPGRLVREEFELEEPGELEVLAAPLFGSFEGNMGHALDRRPVDVCRQRGEPRVVLGNSGVVRVLEVGRGVTSVAPGQVCLTCGASMNDRYGYPEKVLAYDAPGTMGVLATRIKLRPHELLPIPADTRHNLAQWAAFSVRYITAWSNWELAHGTLRLLLGPDELPSPNVWGWGGGTTFAELDLARRFGCRTVMLSGDPRRRRQIEKAGITPLDRSTFGPLEYDDKRAAADPGYKRQYAAAEQAFLREVSRLTNCESVHIFVDYIGEPLFRATLKAMAREGVVATAGWKEGMNITYRRAMQCIARQQFVHTHYARYSQGVAAIAYGEENGWMPEVDDPVWAFDDVPELAAKFRSGEVGLFPVFSVNTE